MAKVINTAKLDKLIGMLRRYWFDITSVDEIQKFCKEYHDFASENLPETATSICYLLDAIFPTTFGLKTDATNEEIYKVLEVLGWEVKECDT